MIIIGVSAKKQGGKSTVVDMLHRCLPDTSVVRFADFLKRIVLTCFIPPEWGWTIGDLDSDENKERVTPSGQTVRWLLQVIGTDWFRHTWSDCWINAYMKKVRNLGQAGCQYILTPDVRFPNELEAIQRANGWVVRLLRGPFRDQDQHESETALDDTEGATLLSSIQIHSDPAVIHPSPVVELVGGEAVRHFDLVLDNRNISFERLQDLVHGPLCAWIKETKDIYDGRGGF